MGLLDMLGRKKKIYDKTYERAYAKEKVHQEKVDLRNLRQKAKLDARRSVKNPLGSTGVMLEDSFKGLQLVGGNLSKGIGHVNKKRLDLFDQMTSGMDMPKETKKKKKDVGLFGY